MLNLLNQIDAKWQTTCLLGAVGLLFFYFHHKNKYSYWRRIGVKGPAPAFFFGNTSEVMQSDFMVKQVEWLKSYGKYYGYYLGTKPVLAICDPEVARQICIKDFSKFPDHENDCPITEYQKNFVFFMSGERWKRVRTLMTPGFTSGKTKRMFKLTQNCSEDLLNALDESIAKAPSDQGAIVNGGDIFGLYSLASIAAGCYGLRLDWFGATNIMTASSRNPLVAAVAVGLFHLSTWRVLFVSIMPRFIIDLIGFTIQNASDFIPLANVAKQLIEKRRSSDRAKYDDYLKYLVDARLGDQVEFDGTEDNQSHHIGAAKQSLVDDQKEILNGTLNNESETSLSQNGNDANSDNSKLTDKELISAVMFLLAAGLEASANTITNTTYLLAFNQDIQEKLYKELKKIVEPETGKFAYEALTSCHYLDAVVSESMRMLPPVITMDRVANSDQVIEKYNLLVKKGTKINIMARSMMNDPDYWTEPEKFNPDRFMPGEREKIVPGSYCPFGLGPRHCLGMRFALTEAKVGLASMVMKYRFEQAPGTLFPPKTSGISIARVLDPLVKIIPRPQV